MKYIRYLMLLTWGSSFGQTLDASIPASACLTEQIEIVNNSTGFDSYEWDFCVGDLELSPEVDIHLSNSAFNIPFTMKLAFDGSWFGFIPSFNSNSLYRYEYQSGLDDVAIGAELTGLDGLLDQPVGIDLVQDDTGNWFAYVVNLGSNALTRISFGTNLQDQPTALNFLGFGLNAPDGIEIIEDDVSYKALITSDDDVFIINLGTDLTQDPALIGSIAVSGSSRLYSISTLKQGNNIYAIMSDRDGNDLHHIDFGSTIGLSPVVSDINEGGYIVNAPVDIEFAYENGNYYGFFAQRNQPVVRMDFGTDVSNLSPTFTEIYDKSDPNVFGFTLAKDSSRWIGMVVSGGMNDIARLVFNMDCGIDIDYRVADQPGDIFYSLDGMYDIELIGLTSTLSDTLTSNVVITTDIAPSITFTIDPSQCISNTNTFTPTTGLTTYSWDFDNDGVEDSNFENANYQFLTPGTHTVRLDVSDGTCNNFLEQQITIYPDTPTPTFDVTGATLCENVEFNFTNTIDETGYDDVLTYEWSINGVVVSSQRDTTYTFDTPGEKIIGLKAAIPGCESTEVTQTINIIPTPQANFTADTVCVNELVLLENLSVNAISYSWDFGDGTNASDFEPSKNYLDSGNYVIALDAIDSSGDCIDTELKTIRVNRTPPGPIFELGTSTFCVGQNLNLANLTVDDAFNEEVTYQWNITDFGMISGKDVDLTFTTIGEKTITLQSFYRTCESAVVQQTIAISDLPVADFSASSICSGETLSFVNQSTDAVSFNWDFDNGFTSTDANPEQLFSTPGLYNVSLTILNQFGCEHTVEKEVVVSSVPEVSFEYDIPCTSTDGIQFTDLSTVAGADIVSRTWFVEDVLLSEAQNLQNPILTFGTEGTINVRLVTVSSNGCEASYNEDIQILSTPQPDFSVIIGCDGESTSFNDMTASPGNTVGSWLWTLDGVNYNTQDISHTFSGSGTFDVTLEVTGQNFCSETITQQLTILELPTVDFSIDGDCSNEVITLTDASTTSQDPIVSREWRLDGSFEGNGNSLILESLLEGTYDLMLEVTTVSGCVTNNTKQLVINQAPQSDFSASRTFGVPGDQLTFTNQSIGASNYQWLLDGQPLSTDPDQQQVTFTDPGTYQLSLTAENSLGCTDISTSEILIAVPEVDLSIGQFEVVENQGTGTIFLEIENNSNLPIEVTEAVIELQNQFSVTEQIEALIGIGETQLVSLNIGIPLSSTELSYLCVTLNSQYSNYPDLSPINNEKCITISPKVIVEPPFPNPATDYTRVKLVTPESGLVTLKLFNSAGKVEFTVEESATSGLNNYFINLRDLNAGMYFIELNYAGIRSVQRIIKR
ncbi:MAG: PKD domain-containing protein [Cyclobacteriaceae bacterium]